MLTTKYSHWLHTLTSMQFEENYVCFDMKRMIGLNKLLPWQHARCHFQKCFREQFIHTSINKQLCQIYIYHCANWSKTEQVIYATHDISITLLVIISRYHGNTLCNCQNYGVPSWHPIWIRPLKLDLCQNSWESVKKHREKSVLWHFY